MDILILLEANTTLLLIVVGIFSLLIGSFLNAVIYRVPVMLERSWKKDCQEMFSNDSSDTKENQQTFNILTPRSQCPSCGHSITALENIPILSYLFLKGKCSGCSQAISIEYPLVEIMTTILSVVLAWKFGYSLQLAFGLIFLWTLIALFMIDAKTMYLPDNLTYPLLWLGIIVNLNGIFVDLESSVLGAIFGYLSLWSVYHLFKLVTGKEGMGYGDFKLLAVIGAWGGWQILPFVIMSSAFLGAILGSIWMFVIKKNKAGQPIPFGPWLAMAGIISVVFRTDVIQFMQLNFAL